MKIICAGFWKTGTKSLAQALRILGYKVHDYDDQMFAYPELWSAFLNGTVTDEQIRDTLKDIDVVIDGPAIAFWEEIHRAIPEAKVILSTRDENGWFKSYQTMCRDAPWYVILGAVIMGLTPAGYRFLKLGLSLPRLCIGVEGLPRVPMLTCTPSNARLYKMQFRRHNSHVLQTVPEHNLHVHKVGDGWEGLCEFLGAETPDVPYPHKNKLGAHFTSEGGAEHPEMKRLQRQGAMLVAVLGMVLAYGVYKVFF